MKKEVDNIENQKLEEQIKENEEAKVDESQTESQESDKKEDFQTKYNELFDKYQRLMAEFENYRKRNEKEKLEMYDMGMTSCITRFLPIVDNFERGISSITEEAKKEAINDGFIKVYDQLLKALESMEVYPIEALNKEFDPNLHNAVMHDEDSEKETNMIVEEFQKGYKYKEKVIRYSMVKVVN